MPTRTRNRSRHASLSHTQSLVQVSLAAPAICRSFLRVHVRCPRAYLSPCHSRSVGRLLARSFARSLARALPRSPVRPVARSLDRSIARSLGRSLDRSIDRSIARSLSRSLARSIGRSLARAYARSSARDLDLAATINRLRKIIFLGQLPRSSIHLFAPLWECDISKGLLGLYEAYQMGLIGPAQDLRKQNQPGRT